jgi:hypothetical protein
VERLVGIDIRDMLGAFARQINQFLLLSPPSATGVEINAPWILTTMVSPSQVRGSVIPQASMVTFNETLVLLRDSRASGLEGIRHLPLLRVDGHRSPHWSEIIHPIAGSDHR